MADKAQPGDMVLIERPTVCRLCGGELYWRRRAGDGYLPECRWLECEQCGEAASEPA